MRERRAEGKLGEKRKERSSKKKVRNWRKEKHNGCNIST